MKPCLKKKKKSKKRTFCFLNYFMCMSNLTACIYVYKVHVWYLKRSEDNVKTPGIKVRDGCKPPYECWELKLHFLQEQQMLSHLSSPSFLCAQLSLVHKWNNKKFSKKKIKPKVYSGVYPWSLFYKVPKRKTKTCIWD